MHLRPHLHLLLPSSNPSILLETRVYIPHFPLHGLSTSSSSIPRSVDELSTDSISVARDSGVDEVVLAAHPWGKLGGNMLDPVLLNLVEAAFELEASSSSVENSNSNSNRNTTRRAIVTYNVRGVGASQGSAPWLVHGVGHDPADFGAVEAGVADLLRPETVRVRRVGYSWGCILAALAPTPESESNVIRSLLLIAPPLTFVRPATLFSPRSFYHSLVDLHENGVRINMVYGTRDQFTSVDKFRQFELGHEGVGVGSGGGGGGKKEIEGGDHFFRGHRGEELRAYLREWLDV